MILGEQQQNERKAKTMRNGDNILLSGAVLKELPGLSAGALRVYIYLCSVEGRAPGQLVDASVPSIARETGQHNRSTISAINVLVDKGLIQRCPKSGEHANRYRIRFGPEIALEPRNEKQAMDASQTLQSDQAKLPAHSGPSEESLAKVESSEVQSGLKDRPKTIDDLVTRCYKKCPSDVIAKLRLLFPDEADLRRRLEFLGREAGVAPVQTFGFFAQVLRDFT